MKRVLNGVAPAGLKYSWKCTAAMVITVCGTVAFVAAACVAMGIMTRHTDRRG